MKQGFKFTQAAQEKSVKMDNPGFTYVKYLAIFVTVIILTCGLGGRFSGAYYIV